MSISLKKGESISLKKDNNILKDIYLGLGWDTRMDLDSIAYLLDDNNKLIDTVCYKHLVSSGIYLNGDNLTGEGDRDDEIIFISLNKINPSVKKIALYANIFMPGVIFKKTFSKVKGAYIRLVNKNTNQEICKYSLSEKNMNYTAFHFADLNKVDDSWKFIAVGKGTNGSIDQIAKQYK